MIPENWRDEVLKLADSLCAIERVKRTVLSNKIAGDADFFDHLAQGGGCTVDKLKSVEKTLEQRLASKIHTNIKTKVKKSESN